MRIINREILASPVPVVGYVAPSGARAASAGTYILYAAHVAAMAPGTNIGAATPVQIGGGFPKLPKPNKTEDSTQPAHPTTADKAVSDAVAYMRGLAQLRGRNVVWAEKAVREAASLSAEDARAEQVIDFVAEDVPELLKRMDKLQVATQFGLKTLDTSGLTVMPYEPDWRSQILGVITNPNIAYMLLLIGMYGLLFEFYSPGAIVPGVAGAVCLLLALYAFHILPINYTGLALVLLGVALMEGEAFAPSFGALPRGARARSARGPGTRAPPPLPRRGTGLGPALPVSGGEGRAPGSHRRRHRPLLQTVCPISTVRPLPDIQTMVAIISAVLFRRPCTTLQHRVVVT